MRLLSRWWIQQSETIGKVIMRQCETVTKMIGQCETVAMVVMRQGETIYG